MGGNAIKGAVRLGKDDFLRVQNDVVEKLSSHFNELNIAPLKYYRNKKDFGDLDILICAKKPERKYHESLLNKWFGATKYYHNGNITSFDYHLDDRTFQVDLIYTSYDDFETSKFYFSYNDLNNLVGRIAHKLGVKFGFDGLTYQIRTESGKKADKIYLSKEPEEIYSFLGLDYSRYERGFESLEDIFDYVASSKYFNPAIYQMEELNHTNKTRNRKRNTYMNFLKWVATKDFGKRKFFEFDRNKAIYLPMIHNSFTDAQIFKRFEEYAYDLKIKKESQERFNGNLVMEWTGLQGKELGACIKAFKKDFTVDDLGSFDYDVVCYSPEYIEGQFKSWYNEYINKEKDE